MRWYINDMSLQGQFADDAAFEAILTELMRSRMHSERLRTGLYVTPTVSNRLATSISTLREVMQRSRDRNLRIQVLGWLDRLGPFIESDRQKEPDDYFECTDCDVTDSGLGEATRRIKAGEAAYTFSFEGGDVNYARSPLSVDHGLKEDRLGYYEVVNFWTVGELVHSSLVAATPISSWRMLIEAARERFPYLVVPDTVFENPTLAREPFSAVIRDQTLALLGYLNAYMSGRLPGGAEGPEARNIKDQFFQGDRARFTGESPTNQHAFRNELTFPNPDDPEQHIFAHWHGKISYRFYRLHFQWPVPADATKLKVVYLGPKITKS